MKLKGWTLPKRIMGRRPRVENSRSVAGHPDQRWATKTDANPQPEYHFKLSNFEGSTTGGDLPRFM